ncbi:hypothetical protein M0811_00231 [Anaeramoeba ignava]|uniref:Uncharacterized protein n=1 Tax=Anaeramoeba ignava TaxID=1746090 RepID=A0A9Q0LNP7_ANAIG|nr:hypothetical protein M0811_00231 [Anaeramoeba ignava]
MFNYQKLIFISQNNFAKKNAHFQCIFQNENGKFQDCVVILNPQYFQIRISSEKKDILIEIPKINITLSNKSDKMIQLSNEKQEYVIYTKNYSEQFILYKTFLLFKHFYQDFYIIQAGSINLSGIFQNKTSELDAITKRCVENGTVKFPLHFISKQNFKFIPVEVILNQKNFQFISDEFQTLIFNWNFNLNFQIDQSNTNILIISIENDSLLIFSEDVLIIELLFRCFHAFFNQFFQKNQEQTKNPILNLIPQFEILSKTQMDSKFSFPIKLNYQEKSFDQNCFISFCRFGFTIFTNEMTIFYPFTPKFQFEILNQSENHFKIQPQKQVEYHLFFQNQFDSTNFYLLLQTLLSNLIDNSKREYFQFFLSNENEKEKETFSKPFNSTIILTKDEIFISLNDGFFSCSNLNSARLIQNSAKSNLLKIFFDKEHFYTISSSKNQVEISHFIESFLQKRKDQILNCFENIKIEEDEFVDNFQDSTKSNESKQLLLLFKSSRWFNCVIYDSQNSIYNGKIQLNFNNKSKIWIFKIIDQFQNKKEISIINSFKISMKRDLHIQSILEFEEEKFTFEFLNYNDCEEFCLKLKQIRVLIEEEKENENKIILKENENKIILEENQLFFVVWINPNDQNTLGSGQLSFQNKDLQISINNSDLYHFPLKFIKIKKFPNQPILQISNSETNQFFVFHFQKEKFQNFLQLLLSKKRKENLKENSNEVN